MIPYNRIAPSSARYSPRKSNTVKIAKPIPTAQQQKQAIIKKAADDLPLTTRQIEKAQNDGYREMGLSVKTYRYPVDAEMVTIMEGGQKVRETVAKLHYDTVERRLNRIAAIPEMKEVFITIPSKANRK